MNLATRFGNLALMLASDNSEIGSQAFEHKKMVYANSPYVLTREIADVASWTGEAINERQTRLAAHAVKAWPISFN